MCRCKVQGIRDLRVRVKKFKFGYPDFLLYDVTSCAARVTFMTFIDPDRGHAAHVTSRGRSLFAGSRDQGVRSEDEDEKFGYPDFFL